MSSGIDVPVGLTCLLPGIVIICIIVNMYIYILLIYDQFIIILDHSVNYYYYIDISISETGPFGKLL
jgi:hypothetical protein